jgi:nitrogen fixation-related uncharacterized protein
MEIYFIIGILIFLWVMTSGYKSGPFDQIKAKRDSMLQNQFAFRDKNAHVEGYSACPMCGI